MATESDKLNTGAIATLVAVLALTMVAIVAILTAMVRGEVDQEVARKGGTTSSREYRDLVAEQRTMLTQEARWADRDAGVLSIPIERSMKLVVDDIRRDPALATALAADAGVTGDAETDSEDAGSEDPASAEGEEEPPGPPPPTPPTAPAPPPAAPAPPPAAPAPPPAAPAPPPAAPAPPPRPLPAPTTATPSDGPY